MVSIITCLLPKHNYLTLLNQFVLQHGSTAWLFSVKKTLDANSGLQKNSSQHGQQYLRLQDSKSET